MILTSPNTLHCEIDMISCLSLPYEITSIVQALTESSNPKRSKRLRSSSSRRARRKSCRATLFLVRQILQFLQTQKSSEKKSHLKLGKVSSFNHAWQYGV